MTEEEKKNHEKAVKGKELGDAQDYCRQHRLHNRWVTPAEPKSSDYPKRLNLVVDGKNVSSTYWG